MGKAQRGETRVDPQAAPRAAQQAAQRHRHRLRRRRHFGDWKAAGNLGLGVVGEGTERETERGFARVRHAGKSRRGFAEEKRGRNANLHKQDESADSRMEREIVQIMDSAEIFDAEERLFERRANSAEDLSSEWDDDRTMPGSEIFSEVYGRGRLSDEKDVDDDHVEDEDESSSEPPANEYECAFSGSSGDVLTVKHKMGHSVDESDDEDSEEDSELETEGSGTMGENPGEKLFDRKQFELFNASSARLALLSGSDGGDSDNGEDGTRVATVILPFVVPEGATMANLHVTLTSDGRLIDWDHTVRTEAWRQALWSLV